MATVRIPDEQRTLTDQAEVTAYLAKLGIDYERWPLEQRAAANAPADAVLLAYAPEIEKLKARGGYVTADVIDVTAATPNLETMLAKLDRYSTASAQSMFERGRSSTLLGALVRAKWAFVRTYVLRLGFLDGRMGLVLALSIAETTYYKYLKLWLLGRRKNASRV